MTLIWIFADRQIFDLLTSGIHGCIIFFWGYWGEGYWGVVDVQGDPLTTKDSWRGLPEGVGGVLIRYGIRCKKIWLHPVGPITHWPHWTNVWSIPKKFVTFCSLLIQYNLKCFARFQSFNNTRQGIPGNCNVITMTSLEFQSLIMSFGH